MIESKTSRWIAETHAVLSGSNKIMLTLKRWTFRATLLRANKYRNTLYQYSIISKDLHVITVILM